MATPLSRPHAEVGILGQRFDDTLAKFPGLKRPRFLMLRRACVYANADDWHVPVQHSIAYGLHFDNLFRNVGGVNNGFPEPTKLEDVANPGDYTTAMARPSVCHSRWNANRSNSSSPT
jgi:hypothetical protein